MLYKASAPGSLMLLGEHAVLHGGHALVTAINQRLDVTLSPRNDFKIKIYSALGRLDCNLSDIEVKAPFQFVLTTLKKYQQCFPSGFELNIHAEFSDQIGFASSAAVTVATLTVIYAWLKLVVPAEKLILEAREIVRQVQGVGSGADVAASVLGGAVAYCGEPFYAKKIAYDYPIAVVYSGAKTKTAEVIRYVDEQFKNNKHAYETIMHKIAACAKAGINAAERNQHTELGSIMDEQQLLMHALQVNNSALQTIIDAMKRHATILGAKISGSGLGDSVVGLGEINQLQLLDPAFKSYACKIDMCGVSLEKN